MAFKNELIDEINTYCMNDLPTDKFYNNLFLFIKNDKIRDRIILEFKNTRYFYKIFEGLQVSDEKLLIETKMQMIMYAGIHEAIVSYVVLELCKDNDIVKSLLKINKLTEFSIPTRKREVLERELSHDGKDVVPCYYKMCKVDKTKIRYDAKVNALYDMRLISSKMKEDLIEIYEYRNTVHLEAELKKNLDYTIEMSKLAYRRVEGLNIELSKSLIDNVLF
ncbi:MAG: hypothetical protein K5892_06680 [Acholeplasmatales bacterium]|nr:hypothetical protein [Acholeplasmatales bacterium]